MSLYYRSRFHYTLLTNGLEYDFPTAQHAVEAAKYSTTMQARTTLTLAGEDPKAIHRMGKNCSRTSQYEALFIPMMEDILALKFPLDVAQPNFVLSERLMGTGDAYIVYWNYWHDNKLGVCACNRCSHGSLGNNLLGLMLMNRRDTLRENLEEF
jgi:predicted NAD-dependent protein-ADP-ribosyltransferase YbiA (DUF1768 family)